MPPGSINTIFAVRGEKHWIFHAKDPKSKGEWIDLLKMGYIPIQRHVKIIAKATPYHVEWIEYFKKRDKLKLRQTPILRNMYRLRSSQTVLSKAAA